MRPYCTPSHSSFLTGQYPEFTGAASNHKPLNADIKTWAHILRDERGYATSYMGKFHLDGPEKPGWGARVGRDFGFDDNKYRYNRGHWKYFTENNGTVQEYNYKDINEEAFFKDHKEEESYATDFIMDRAMEYMEHATLGDKPFALVITLADPHGPQVVRPHYRDMYKHLTLVIPKLVERHYNLTQLDLSSTKMMKYPSMKSMHTWQIMKVMSFQTTYGNILPCASALTIIL